MKQKIGERIKSIRNTLNLKQKDFAKKLGISPPTLSELESGKSKPAYDVLVNLKEQFNINIYYVLFGKGEMFENPILEFLINFREKDTGIKTEDARKFLEYFGKSRQMQYYILNKYEEKMLNDGELILKEIEESNRE